MITFVGPPVAARPVFSPQKRETARLRRMYRWSENPPIT